MSRCRWAASLPLCPEPGRGGARCDPKSVIAQCPPHGGEGPEGPLPLGTRGGAAAQRAGTRPERRPPGRPWGLSSSVGSFPHVRGMLASHTAVLSLPRGFWGARVGQEASRGSAAAVWVKFGFQGVEKARVSCGAEIIDLVPRTRCE